MKAENINQEYKKNIFKYYRKCGFHRRKAKKAARRLLQTSIDLAKFKNCDDIVKTIESCLEVNYEMC